VTLTTQSQKVLAELRRADEVLTVAPGLDGDYDIATLRRQEHERCELLARDRKVSAADVREIHAQHDGCRVEGRLYRPPDASTCPGVLVWFHGGAFMWGSVDSCDAELRALAVESGWAVLGTTYRFAPEDPFPAGLQDCVAATRWAAAHRGELGVAADGPVAVAGESSGGTLAAAVALATRDEETVALQILVCPPLAVDGAPFPSRAMREEVYAQDVHIEWMWRKYLPREADRDDPLAAPWHARSLTGVAPALVITAEHDVLRDEGERYAARLREAGVTATVRRFDGVLHGFFVMLGRIDEATEAIVLVARALRAELRRRCVGRDD
jgi:acetyl esterase/lipase